MDEPLECWLSVTDHVVVHSVSSAQTEESHPVIWKAEIAKKKRY